MPTDRRNCSILQNAIISSSAAVFFSLVLSACGLVRGGATPSSAPAVLTVMAAASTTETFGDLAAAFEDENPGVKVELIFAGSQQLAQQLANGARADVFASANRKQVDEGVASGRIDPRDVVAFARNQLIVILPAANPAKVSAIGDLARPGVKILLASPDVPVGAYAIQFLEKTSQANAFGADFKTRVLANVVSYEASAKGVLVKVGLGEADAGIVYSTDLTPDVRDVVGAIEIPDELNVTAEYWIAPISNGNRELADLWIDFVQSEAGRELLQQHGFQPAQHP